ncbi:MAG: penicillin-binding transpeptidase domain-containing protein [Terracidiphilus sp.]
MASTVTPSPVMQPTPLRSARMRGATTRPALMKQRRFWLICFFFAFWAIAIATRLFWLQLIHHNDYVERAQKQQQRTFEVAPRRGILYDRNMRELAMTVQVDSIYAVPNEINDKEKTSYARTLASLTHIDAADTQTTEDQIARRLNDGHGFAWIARRVKPEVATQVRALNLKGVYFQKEFQRFYPNSEIAAQALGYVGMDDNGLGGLEQKFDARLHGTPGRVLTAIDARRHVLGSVEHEPDPGQNLQLTIDSNIQYMAETALDHVMEKEHADNGTVVVQDVHTGQILALAIRPTFNPNDFRHTTPKLLKNHAVSDVYEPGSVFKLVTYSSAIDAQVAKPDDMVDCQGGQITLAGRVIHDDKSDRGMGVVTVATALARSSDVAAVKMALKVGPDRFYQYIRDFGFGSRTGVELPGETRGLLRPTNKWNGSSIGSLAIGQEVGVTPVQLVSMVSTIANGGTYLPPRILLTPPTNSQGSAAPQAPQQAHPFRANEELPNPLPPGAHRVISEMAAAQMRKMMEGVILYGTGKPAQLNGYSSGGKTGTAQKVDPATHLYSKTMHIASFAGIAPVNNPAIAIAVVIDNPKVGSYYGTAVSAPVFAEVAQQVLEYLGVPHDIDVQPPKTTAKKEKTDLAEEDADADQDQVNSLFAAVNDLPPDDPLRNPQPASQPAPPAITGPAAATLNENSAAPQGTASSDSSQDPAKSASPQGTAPQVPAKSATPPATVTINDGKKLAVPSLIGLPVRKVIETAATAGLDVQIVGSGIAREQAPAPGTKVPAGTKIVVHCGR